MPDYHAYCRAYVCIFSTLLLPAITPGVAMAQDRIAAELQRLNPNIREGFTGGPPNFGPKAAIGAHYEIVKLIPASDSQPITDLDFLEGSAINDVGSVVGSYASGSDQIPFIWHEGALTDLYHLDPNLRECRATGVNDGGIAVGMCRVELEDPQSNKHIVSHAVLWQDGTPLDLALPDTLPGGAGAGYPRENSAVDINKVGQIVGAYHLGGFLWDNGTVTNLGYLPGNLGVSPEAINDAGEIVGYSATSAWNRAWIWREGEGMTELDSYDGGHAYAADINNSGVVVGSVSGESPTLAALWKKEDLVLLPVQSAQGSAAAAVNDAGEVVGTKTGGTFCPATCAFLWSEKMGEIVLNNLLPPGSGWELEYAFDINENGLILGRGKFDGETHYFLLYPRRGIIVNSTADLPDPDTSDNECDTGRTVRRDGSDDDVAAGDDESECTLRAAIMTANAREGKDEITYDIPATGPHIIRPHSPLPPITAPLVLNGTMTLPDVAAKAAEEEFVVLDGAEAGAGADGFVYRADSDSSELLGHVIVNYQRSGVRVLADDFRMERCFIGVSRRGERMGNHEDGVYLSASRARIGDGQFENANTIAYNAGAGIYVARGSGNTFRSNVIFANEELGIDLAPRGVTRDAGRPYPRIDSVEVEDFTTTLYGTLLGTPGKEYRIEIFFNTMPDSTGRGEGEAPVVSTDVSMGAASEAAFSTVIAARPGSRPFICLTATDRASFVGSDRNGQNTTEFSLCWPRLLRVVDVDDKTIPNKTFRLARVEDDRPVFREEDLGEVTTDDEGLIYLRTPEIQEGDRMRISRRMWRQPSLKSNGVVSDAIWTYLDNAEFDANTYRLSYDEVGEAAPQEVKLDHSTLALNIVASIEWDASLTYVERLERGFRHLSNYIYDVTDGQMRLDTVYIYDDMQQWEKSDFWIYANNFHHADAVKGGLNTANLSVRMPRRWYGSPTAGRIESVTEHLRTGSADPSHRDNYRTLGHELGHYALGFDDEYKLSSADAVRCSRVDVPNYGFMENNRADPAGTEMSWSATYSLEACRNTMHFEIIKKSCWDYFEQQFEKEAFEGIPFPILTPGERGVESKGSAFFFGPNDDVGKLDYDVGRRVQFPIVHTAPSRVSRLFRVDGTYGAIPNVEVTQLIPTPARAVLQGRTSEKGEIVVLGWAPGDGIEAEGLGLTVVPAKRGEDQLAWYSGSIVTADTTSGIALRPVTGSFPLLARLRLTNGALEYDLAAQRPLPSDPVLEVLTAHDETEPTVFVATAAGYTAPLTPQLPSLGMLRVRALDEASESFFFTTPYRLFEFAEDNETSELVGPHGHMTLQIDSADADLQQAVILSSAYPAIRTGLNPEQRQVGATYALSVYPTGTPTSGLLSIRYEETNLEGLGDSEAERTVRIFRWNDAHAVWHLVGGHVDTTHNAISAPITDPGIYAAFTTGDIGTDANAEPDYGDEDVELPAHFALHASYPNPFNPRATIPFDVKETARVVLKVYNVLGQEVSTLVDRHYAPGRYSVPFDGLTLPSGMYLYQIEMADFRDVRAMVLLR